MPNVKKFDNYITDVKNNISPIMLSGLTDVGKIHFAYATHFYAKKPIVIITYNEIQAKKIIQDLKFFKDEVIYFPKREIVTYDYLAESKDLLNDRIEALNEIYKNNAKIIVTTIEAVSQKIISKENLYKNILELKVGKKQTQEELKEKLVSLGYERYDLVEGKGQFSVRGGIVDIATSSEKGVRLEFFGDEIDSIRYFDISSQRSIEMLKEITIYPAYEFVLEKSLEEVVKSIVEEDIEAIKSGDYINKVDKYFNSFYTKQETLVDYLSEDYIIFLDEVERIKTRIDNIIKNNKNIISQLTEKEKIVPDGLRNISDYVQFVENILNKQVIYLCKNDLNFIDKKSMHAKRNGYSFSYREANFFRSTMDLLLEEIQKAVRDKKTVIILNENEENRQAMEMLLKKYYIEHHYVGAGSHTRPNQIMRDIFG
ncbi:MAG: hypothetical protein FWF46_02725 [Oscillospiraceae bacterium]|nr:hypothetical protein [Oscillospiraceae bacterium]